MTWKPLYVKNNKEYGLNVRNRHNLTAYLTAFIIILALNFLLPRMMPGDPLTAVYGSDALVAMTPELKARLVEAFALVQSIWRQLGAYFAALFRWVLGYTCYYIVSVLHVIL